MPLVQGVCLVQQAQGLILPWVRYTLQTTVGSGGIAPPPGAAARGTRAGPGHVSAGARADFFGGRGRVRFDVRAGIFFFPLGTGRTVRFDHQNIDPSKVLT